MSLTDEQKSKAKHMANGYGVLTFEQKQSILGSYPKPECGGRSGCNNENMTFCRRKFKNGSEHFGLQCKICGAWKSISKNKCSDEPSANFDESIQDRVREKYNHYWSLHKELDDFLLELRTEKKRDWWKWYNQYLNSQEWRERRKLVLDRDPICRGCGLNPSSQVHHLSYENVGDEFLWELVGICFECHQKAHPDKEMQESA